MRCSSRTVVEQMFASARPCPARQARGGRGQGGESILLYWSGCLLLLARVSDESCYVAFQSYCGVSGCWFSLARIPRVTPGEEVCGVPVVLYRSGRCVSVLLS